MNRKPSPLVFSAVFGIVYTTCFYNNWALFRFYPAYSQFARTPLGTDAGPAILWYGWLANAFIVSGVAAVIVPRALANKVNPSLVCGIGVATLLAIVIFLRTWFI